MAKREQLLVFLYFLCVFYLLNLNITREFTLNIVIGTNKKYSCLVLMQGLIYSLGNKFISFV